MSEESSWPAQPPLSDGAPTTVGDPRNFAPDLLSRLTAMERKHVGRAHEWYIRKHGGGAYWTLPADETPRRMARKIVRHGVWGATWTKTAPVMILLIYPIGWCLLGGSAASITAGIVLALCEPVLGLRILRRERQVVRWFDELYPERSR